MPASIRPAALNQVDEVARREVAACGSCLDRVRGALREAQTDRDRGRSLVVEYENSAGARQATCRSMNAGWSLT